MAGRGWGRLGAGVLAGAVLAGGIAVAAIPHSETGQISACYTTGGATPGRLRVIDRQAGEHCVSGEAALTWNRGIRWRGAWKAERTYEVGDAVARSGSSYLAVEPSAGKNPVTSPSAWGVLAQRGAAGPAGPSGPAAQAVDIVLPADDEADIDLGDDIVLEVECEGTPPHEMYVWLDAPSGSAVQVQALRSHDDVNGFQRAIGTMIIDGGGVKLRTFTFDALVDERPFATDARCRLHGAVVTAT